ncbi:hypothetical protein ACHOLT_05980 [Desulfitobacterium sp. Sab5]|uniref:hypothetical protein n=1 Tax=Desulfitobacterium nosdiversum TaxID=3375356 RepID=UPI003CF5C81C
MIEKEEQKQDIGKLILIVVCIFSLLFASNLILRTTPTNGQAISTQSESEQSSDEAKAQQKPKAEMVPVTDQDIKVRKFPYPYQSMLAISSDIDSTSLAEFEDYHRFLNTKEKTPYGQGLGLDIADSAWMYIADNYGDKLDHEGHSLVNSMSYFQGVNPKVPKDADKIIHYYKAGWIDSLHTFGDFSRNDKKLLFSRELADLAWKEMRTSGFMPEVWINHGTETNVQNFGAYNPKGFSFYQAGDDPKSPYYHTDLTLGNGIKFVWNSVGMSQFSYDDPLFPIKLRDGKQVWGFYRYAYDMAAGKRIWTWEVHELPRQFNKAHLDELAQNEKYSVVAQHLGKGYEALAFNTNDVQALQLLKKYQDDRKILVARTERLLNYDRVNHYIRFSVLQSEGKFYINLTKIEDPVLGESTPILEDVRGLTFYVNDPGQYTLLINSVPIPDQEIQRNGADKSGKQSIGIKWFEPDYTDYTRMN